MSQKRTATIRQRLLAGDTIRTHNASPGIRYTVWQRARREDLEHYLEDPDAQTVYVIARDVLVDPTAFNPGDPWIRPLDEAVAILATLAEARGGN
jgi:hypothetical protein